MSIAVGLYWKEIENMLADSHDASLSEMLLPAASEVELDGLEAELGITLTEDYKESLRIHSGTAYWVWLWDSVSLNSPGEVVVQWRELLSFPVTDRESMRSSAGVRAAKFDPKWIPIGRDNKTPICLDLNPAAGGRVGQVIAVDWEDAAVTLLSDNFSDWLAKGVPKMRAQLDE